MSAIRLVAVKPTLIAAVTRKAVPSDISRVLLAGLDLVWAAIRSHGLRHGHNVAVYRRPGCGGIEMLCGVEVAARFDDIGDVACRETPGGWAVTATHIGPYGRLGEAYDAIAAWARLHGHALAGTNWEVYGDWADDPAELETEVYMLTASQEGASGKWPEPGMSPGRDITGGMPCCSSCPT
jgi:hypothetical protein